MNQCLGQAFRALSDYLLRDMAIYNPNNPPQLACLHSHQILLYHLACRAWISFEHGLHTMWILHLLSYIPAYSLGHVKKQVTSKGEGVDELFQETLFSRWIEKK